MVFIKREEPSEKTAFFTFRDVLKITPGGQWHIRNIVIFSEVQQTSVQKIISLPVENTYFSMFPLTAKLLKQVILFVFFFIALSFTPYCQDNNPLINSGELIKQGIGLHDEGKFKDAIALYKQVSRSDTNYDKALYELSMSTYADNQFQESKKYAELGLKLFPERADEFYLQIANALDNLDKPQEAFDLYEKVIKLYPLQYILYFNEGIALRNLKRQEDAKAAFQKSLMINPTYPSSHFFLGKNYLEQGDIVAAMLAFQTYLLVAPSGKYSKNVVQYLSDISKGADVVLTYAKNKSRLASPGFDLIQEIVLSKIALDKQYQLNTKLEDAIVRQIQVVLEKLEYDKKDKSFAMQFYVPFYSKIIKDKMFEPMIYLMFSGLGVEDIDNWNKKHKTEIEDFTNYGSAYFLDLKTTQVLDAEDRKNAKIKYAYSNGKLYGEGTYINEEKEIPGGEWEFYNSNTKVGTHAFFDTGGKRTGEWIFYYPDGSLEEKYNYNNGKLNGLTQGWFKNGNQSYIESYNFDLPDGVQTLYYYNGNIKSQVKYNAGKKEGVMKEYFNTGNLSAVTNYKDDKKEGLLSTYYKNGVTETTWNYINDEGNGPYKSYSQRGKLIQEGNTIEGKRDGQWISYYDNGKLKDKTTYTKGDVTGEYLQYFENGTISQKGNYYKGKSDGKVEVYDEDGKLSSDFVYDKGKLKEVNFYDKNRNIISSTGTRKGAATITYFDPSGIKISEGFFNKEGNREGAFTYYYPSGKINQTENYKDGELDGNAVGYYSNGEKKFESQYIEGKQDGYAKNYYYSSGIEYEGWIKDGQKEGVHINYDPFGNIISKENYLNDELNNYTEYFYPGAKTDYESKYSHGWLQQITQLDSTGRILAENVFKKGTGPLIFKHYTGKNMIEGTYKNYELDGIYRSFYFDGSPESVRYYTLGESDSTYTVYYFGGGVKTEGKFKNGDRVGEWKYYTDNGKVNEVEIYENGKLSGEDKYFREDGTPDKVVTYKDGEIDGPYRFYAENNQLAVQLNYKKGVIKSYTYEDKEKKPVNPILLTKDSGKVTAYFPNGNKSADIDIIDGIVNGVRKIYFTSGKPYIDGSRKNDYDDGVKKVYFIDGTLNTEQVFLNGALHGISKTYYPSGKLQSEQTYYNGGLHGTVRYFDEKGSVKQTRTYYYNNLLTAN